MPKGIVRAAERVAFWHEAAETWEQQLGGEVPDPEPAPTSESPAGAAPEPAAPAISKSKKFLQPAKQLKTTLENSAHPSQGFHPESTQAVEGLLNSKPDFTKTYFKPQYQDMLKTHLGDENYAKLLHHAPTPFTDALTTHTQQPAPNSKKWSVPANQLKKILDDPHTETAQVTDWLQGPGAAFAKSYLKPGYDDALKSHLGEDKYHELQQHLQAPSQSEVQQPKKLMDKLNEADPEGQYSEHGGWNWDTPEGQKTLQNMIKEHQEYGEDETAAKLQQVHDEHFGNQPAEKPIANPFTELLKNQAPEQSHNPSAGLLANEIAKVFPAAPTNNMTTPQLKTQLEQWLKYLPDHEGYAAHVPQLQKLYDQHFGESAAQQPKPGAGMPFFDEYDKAQGQEQQSEPPQHHKDHAQILDSYGEPSEDFMQWFAHDNNHQWGQNPATDKELLAMLADPENKWTQQKVKGYLKAQDAQDAAWATSEHDADGHAGNLSDIAENLAGDGVDSQAPSYQAWESALSPEAAAHFSQNPEAAAQSYDEFLSNNEHLDTDYFGGEDAQNPGATPQAQGGQSLGDAVSGITDDGGDQYYDGVAWNNWSPEKQKQQLLDEIESDDYGPNVTDQLKQIYEDHFGGDQQQHQFDTSQTPSVEHLVSLGVDPSSAKTISSLSPTQFWKNVKSVQDVQAENPGWTPPESWQPIMEALGGESSSNEDHIQAIQDLLQPVHQQQPSPLDTDALAEGIHAINPGFVLDKVKGLNPENLKSLLQGQANAHKGTPKGDQYQQLLEKHFGGGGSADEHQQNLSTMANYLDQQGWDTSGPAYQKWLGNLSPQQVAFFAQYPEEAHAAFDDYVPSQNKQVDYQLPQFGDEHTPKAPQAPQDLGALTNFFHQAVGINALTAQGSAQAIWNATGGDPAKLASYLQSKYPAAMKKWQEWQHAEQPAAPAASTGGPAPFDSYAIAKGVQAADPGTFDDNWVRDTAKNSTPEQWKGYLESWIKSDYSPQETAQYQALLDKYFGEGTSTPASPVDPNAYPGASFAGQGEKFWADLPSGFLDWHDGESHGPQPGVGAFLESKGYGPEEIKALPYNSADQISQISLMQDWGALPDVGKQQFAAQEHEGQQVSGGPTDQPGTAPQPQDIIDWMGKHGWGSAAPGFSALKSMSDPAQMAAQLESMKENFGDTPLGTKAKQELQNAIDHFFGDQQSVSLAKPYSSTAAWSDWKKIYPSSKAKSTFADAAQAKAWIEHKLSLKSTTPAAAAKKQQIKQFYDKHFGDAGQSGSSGIDINTTKPDKAGLEKFFDTLWPTLQGDKEIWVNNQLGSSTWNSTYFKEHYPQEWAQAEKYFGQGGQSQPVKPDFDWKAFGPEWMALSPNSSWGKSTHSEADTEAKLKDAVESANASYPGTEKTKALGELYQKWFPGGSSSAGGSAPVSPPSPKGSASYQNLRSKSDALSHLFSDADRKTLKSPAFREWYDQAPNNYRSYVEDNPGIALDDYAAAQQGGPAYSVPEGSSSGTKTKYYDVSPFAMVPQKGKGVPKALTHNTPRGDFVKFPHKQDEQETFPLGPGQKWAPGYEPLPIYRVMNLNLDHQISPNDAPAHVQGQKQRGLWAQQQTARLRRIDEILNGASAQRDPKEEFQKLKSWGSKYGLTDKEVADVAGMLFSEQPDLFADDKWQHLADFAKAKGIDPAEMHDLAQKLDVTPPSGTKGDYDHPELGQLVLDYLENHKHRSDEGGGPSQGGLGWHWTRAINKMYKGVPAAGIGKSEMKATPRNVPIALSGLWAGQGEGGTGSPDSGHGGAYEVAHPGEKEHNLLSHAPVHIRRVQIRAPGSENQGYGAWHDIIDHGPISTWGTGRYEEGDEKSNSSYAPDPMVKFKPSLAEELNKTIPGYHDPETFDKLTPGHKADMTFTHLLHEHPEQKDQLLKLYEMFFVGRPDLPTKPHTRRASLQHQSANPHDLDPRNPAHLFELAKSWGIANPERYGLPQGLGELARDLKGVGFAWKSQVKQHGLGRPVQRENLAALEDQITRLAANHLPDPEWMAQHFPGGEYDTPDKIAELYQDNPHSWVFQQYDQDNPDDDESDDTYYHDDDDYESDADDDYEYNDEDFEDPPLPTMDRPKGWPQQAPWLKNDPRNRQYFPPHGLNAPSSSPARPDIDWADEEHEQDPLPFRHDFVPGQEPRPGGQHQLFDVGLGNEGYEWPKGAQPTPLYRGLMVDLNHKDLAPLRRSLLGGEYEDDPWYKNNAQPHPQGYNNPALGEHLLNHIENNPKSYEGHSNYGLGPHWSLNEGTAQDFAQQTTLGSQGHPLKLPTVVRSQWKGLGEDPYRTNTQGDWPEEGEVTMLPGTQMHIDSVKIQHPKTKDWHEVLGEPTQRHATKSNDRQVQSKVDVRRPRGVLTHAERRL